ncbi:hypothetical protein ACJMK2_037987 [Sinanodonta woodiana]|uniref:Luciferin 4-monooxygenase n=1 Tax=Sinanodonta woodiana TaxID=1069815 RepID=A0ABD3WQK3_SINWO
MLQTLRLPICICSRNYHKSEHTVPIPDYSLTDYLFRNISKFGKGIALVDYLTNRSITFDQLYEEVDNVANNLYALGLRTDDCVCLYGTNVPEFAHVVCSVTSNGASLTIANSQLTAVELAHQLKATNSKFIFTTSECTERARTAAQIYHKLQEIIVLGNQTGFRPFSNLTERPRIRRQESHIDPKKHTALLPFSSGTTGLPKGVELTHYNLVAELSALSHRLFLPFDPKSEKSLSVLPMVHIAGLVIGMLNPLSQGASVVTLPRFDPQTFLEAMEKHRITFCLIAPPLVSFLAKHPLVAKYDLSSFHTPYSGAAALGKELTMQMVERLKLTGIRQGYGMTESSPATHTTPLNGYKYGSIGIPLPNTESKIVHIENGTTLGPNEPGEIWVRGPQVMKGYFDNAEATRTTLTDDGWLKTGDIGYYDNDSDYYVVDRLKEIIKYKGYQVAPAYLEGILLSHPSVGDVAVIGIPHGAAGDVPRAYVVRKSHVSGEELSAYVESQVAPYKRLRGGVVFVSELPRSASGKLLRNRLREEFLDKDSREISQS